VDDVGPLLQAFDVFVFPSRTEGMSNSFFEACGHCRVIVASDIPGNRAMVGEHYPLLIEPGDPEVLAASLLKAFTDQEARGIAVAALGGRKDRFSVDAVLDQLEGLLFDADRARH
jgi:glycosyltransferase involved in cell wall biosynthesis